ACGSGSSARARATPFASSALRKGEEAFAARTPGSAIEPHSAAPPAAGDLGVLACPAHDLPGDGAEARRLFERVRAARIRRRIRDRPGPVLPEAIELASCQPTVEALLLFHVSDELDLAAWQSGVYYADDTPKSSLTPVRA